MNEYKTLTFGEEFWKQHGHYMGVTEDDLKKADPETGYIKTVGNGYHGECKLYIIKLLPADDNEYVNYTSIDRKVHVTGGPQ